MRRVAALFVSLLFVSLWASTVKAEEPECPGTWIDRPGPDATYGGDGKQVRILLRGNQICACPDSTLAERSGGQVVCPGRYQLKKARRQEPNPPAPSGGKACERFPSLC